MSVGLLHGEVPKRPLVTAARRLGWSVQNTAVVELPAQVKGTAHESMMVMPNRDTAHESVGPTPNRGAAHGFVRLNPGGSTAQESMGVNPSKGNH